MAKTSEMIRLLLSTVGIVVGALFLTSFVPPSLSRFVFPLGLLWAAFNLFKAFRNGELQGFGSAIGNRSEPPPLWPPRRPDDWGIEIQRKYERAVASYQSQQNVASAGGIRLHGSPPRMPLIPSWEEHHRRLQERDPIQIRWAQTDSADWHKVMWGNRAITPPAGQALPVFQSMQRADNGKWVWVGLGSRPDFSWQNGPLRVEDFQMTDAKGNTVTVRRPCGHPSYVEPPAMMQSDVGGTAMPMTDEELLQAGATHSVHDTAPVEPANDPEPVATRATFAGENTHGAAAPLSDEELAGMGATHKPSSDTAPPEPPTDPTKWAGVI